MKQSPKISAFTIIVAFVAISLVGLALIPSLTVKLSPSRTLPKLSVSFNMPGNSARVVEMEATSKLEAMLARIEGVKNIYSTSSNNKGSITLELDKHASMDMVRFEASTIIRQTWSRLPESTSYPTIHISSPDEEASRPFLIYNIDATTEPNLIQQYAEEHIKPRLAQIAGIYRIDIDGATPMEWFLEYDITQLEANGITVNKIRDAISNYNDKESLGMVLLDNDAQDKRYIRLTLTSTTERQDKKFHAEDIYVSNNDGKLFRLDQLVNVTYREQPPTSYYRINGLNSIYISIVATEDANQLRLAKTIKSEMTKIKASLPYGYELHVDYDATEHINDELNKIYIRTSMTILILLLFVFLITFNARYLLLIVLSLFFDIAIAFIFYYLLKLEIQLYSLAGITISLSLIIDNTIIMADHYLRCHNRNVFLSMLAATLTTVGALAMIFFLDEEIRLNLQDFAAVVMINLLVSLAVAFAFVPAVAEKMNIRRKNIHIDLSRLHFSPKRVTVRFNRLYYKMIHVLLRFRPVIITILILAFGLPTFLLPDKIERETKFAEKYNKFVSSSTFKEKVKPIIDKSLGGTLRLFAEKVYNGGYYSRSNEETVLTITASMPNGTTMQQMNTIIQKMESYLSEFKEIRQFQTSIGSPLRASINVMFTKEAERSGFPYTLKNNVISKALQLGGGSWGVFGLQDQGFSNDVRENAGNMRAKIYGYNYDDLYMYADTLRHRLEAYRRINEVLINSQYSWYKDDYREYAFNLNLKRLAAENIIPSELYASINPVFSRDIFCGYISGENQTEQIKMSSIQSREYDLWGLSNLNRSLYGKNFKTGDLATVEKMQTPQSISKENQQYVLYLQYEYIGSGQQAEKVLDKEIKDINKILPIGYTAKSESGYMWWRSKDSYKQYLFLALIIIIIFFITSILFNSLKNPFAVLFVIPISYIGVFLTFYLFKLNFDTGGFASFVLLCGITVNSSIYILSEFNNILRRKPSINPIRAYIKAWNVKIIPILLTIISTILGFIPFMIGLEKESFWFPLAAGTIGGLIMSLIGIFVYLPLYLIKRKK